LATLIDASALVAAERGLLNWDRVVGEHEATEVALAAITAAELLHVFIARLGQGFESLLERHGERVRCLRWYP
jgi:hypothetical protein